LKDNTSYPAKVVCPGQMSILGGVGGLRCAVFNVGIALTGLLLTAFAVGLYRGINGGRVSWAGSILVVLGSVGMIGSAISTLYLQT